MTPPAVILAWHQVAASLDPAGLDALLADDVVFRSPALFAPQEGKALTTTYLTAAMKVLGPTLDYVEEWYAEHSAVLEFKATVDGREVHGVDMIRWNDDGQITSFTVMVRPMSGLNVLMPAMVSALGL